MGHIREQGGCISKNPEQIPRILLVEDCPRENRNLAFQLQNAGFEVTLECCEQAAIHRFGQESNLANPFNLVLLNLRIQTLDSSELILGLRQRGFTGVIAIFDCDRDGLKNLRLHAATQIENSLHATDLDRLMDILTDSVSGQIVST